MEPRKRPLTECNESPSQFKKAKSEEKEQVFDNAESDDSFENFGKQSNKVSPFKSISPRTRSAKISIEVNDEDDSFDSPVTNSKPIISENKNSGVEGFPCLNDKTSIVYLEVLSFELRDDCLDVECRNTDGNPCMVYMQGRWSSTLLKVGNFLNIIGATRWGDDDLIVDDDKGIVVVNPDILVPCTAIASATWCSRKVILNDRFKFGNGTNKAMLLGTIMHQVFQIAVLHDKNHLKETDLLEIWNTESSKYAEELVALSFTPKCLDTELKPYLSIICNWINKHITNKKGNNKIEVLPSKAKVQKVYDIEENIWDNVLGMKGKVDLTLQTIAGNMESLELKTGKSKFSAEHSGQVLLYCMMLSNRYNQPIGSGNLLYLKDGISRSVNPKATDLLSIIQQRNGVSNYLESLDANELPETKKDPKFCEKCEHKVMCAFYQKKEEIFSNSSEAMKEFAEKEMSHLNENHFEYISKWIRWISLEWKEESDRSASKIKDLWRKPIQERMDNGTCIPNLIVISEESTNFQKEIITFKRSSHSQIITIRPGDSCILSSKTQSSIGFAVIESIEEDIIRVRFEKKIQSRYSPPFCLDKYNSYSNYSTLLGNLVYFTQNDDIGNRLRSILVDLEPPIPTTLNLLDVPNNVKLIIMKAKLNKEQRLAVLTALFTESYMIAEGLPGSGKTTLISVLIQCLVATGKSVLLAAFTHSAVDNILSKVMKEVPMKSMLRLGSSATIKHDIQPLTLKSKLEDVDEQNYYGAVKNIMKTTPIVACTCHHVPRELLFSYRQFDIVIIDEASMVLEPLVLPVIATSKKFVLVGDCKQLTPLVLAKKSKVEGAEISTMKKLQDAHRECVQSLTSQYRMNSVISELSSKLFYENRLVCGNDIVSHNCLDKNVNYKNIANHEDRFESALSGDLKDSCVFIDTQCSLNESMKCDESDHGGVLNRGEAELINVLCNKFIQNGIQPSDIGVMSVYRKQVDHIREVLDNESLEVNTVDSYQGREKKVIIWSLTWTDSSQKKSELLKDEKRVNVAVTRSQQKLVIIGCRKSVETIPILYRLTQLIPNFSSITC